MNILFTVTLTRRMKNRHFYILIALIHISAVGLILQETSTIIHMHNQK